MIQPYDIGNFTTDDGQTIYYEQSGHPLGVPVLYLHGGPGAGLDQDYHKIIPPLEHIRLIGIDQRGSGKSKPLGNLKNNTIEFLVKDLEQLRSLLHISSWYIFGGSWGSTLALSYAVFHPNNVRGLNLWGIFFCNEKEINWLFKDTAPIMYADIYKELFQQSPSSKYNLIQDYKNKLQLTNKYQEVYATKWLLWEAFTAEHPEPLFEDFSNWKATPQALACAIIENYYFSQAPLLIYGLKLEHQLEQCNFNFPIYISHGRNDLVTPAASALKLKEIFPSAHLEIIKNSGHSLQHDALKQSILTSGKKLLSL